MHDKEKAPRLGGEGADGKVVTDDFTTVGSPNQTDSSSVNNSIGRWAKGDGRWPR